MKRTLVAGAVGLLAIFGAGATPAFAQSEPPLEVELSPLNRSDASGSAAVSIDGDQVTVTVETNGVAPALPHAQHIHIGGQNVCPPESAGGSTEPNDLISTAEGKPFYGAVEVSLTTEGDVGAGSALAVERFPVADDSGSYTYTRTFDLPEGVTQADLGKGVVVVHGISTLFGDPAQYDGEPRSSLNPDLPLETTIPALCGAFNASIGGTGETGTPAATQPMTGGGESAMPQGGVAAGAGGTAADPMSPFLPATAVALLGGVAVLIARRRHLADGSR